MKKFITTILCTSVLIFHNAIAQDSEYVYIPKQQPLKDDESFKSLNCNQAKTLDELLGEKVVFIAQTKQLQQFGYSSFHWAKNPSVKITYNDLVGKIGIITDIQPRPSDGLNFRRVIIKLEISGESLEANALDDSIPNITLLSDIQEGRKRWVGKHLWYRSKYIRPSTDAEPSESQRIKKYQPVTVTNVMVGADTIGSIDFVLQFASGQEGLAGVNLSASNTSPNFIKTLKAFGRKECSFDDFFFTEDPRLARKWTDVVWNAIENEQILVGMDVDQVTLSWGPPKNINETRTGIAADSQWVYGKNRYVYFNNEGKVRAIQE